MNHKDSTVSAAQYWGYLIKPDKTPTPIFEQLLLGVASYINRHIAPWDVHCLTPTKLATFYRLVGGDYDPLFLDTSRASISFIYQSLGCLHTLQPEKNPYSPPTVPALTPQGFVRWQTVQLLLEPEEHVPFLQEAVKRFELTNPTDGELFPSVLPREALPAKPDLQMTEWHDHVSEKLMLEAQASNMRNMPRRPQMALSDAGQTESSRPSSGDSTIETSSIMGATGNFSHPMYQNSRSHLPTRPFVNTQSAARGIAGQQTRSSPAYDAPWSPLRRRMSMPSDNRPQYHHPSSWNRGPPTSPHHPYKVATQSQAPQNHLRAHTRSPSTLSESSFTSDSSYTTSSASRSPGFQSAQLHPQDATAQSGDFRRSQSMGYFHPPPQHAVYPSTQYPTQAQPPPPQWPSSGIVPPPTPSGSDWTMNANNNNNNSTISSSGTTKPTASRGRNVRWPDQDQSTPRPGDATSPKVNRSATIRAPPETRDKTRSARSARSVDGRRSERTRDRERRGQSVGVGRRTYA